MATYPIKMLRDEEGKPFVPLISIDSIKEIDGEGLEEKLDKKLETTNIKAGSQIEIKTEGNNVIISNAAEGMKLIDSLNTDTPGDGALDAHQGKVLKESIPEIVNNLTTIDSQKALSAHQGYVLAGRVAPTGGATGQVLKKASDSDYSFEWGDAADPNAIVGDGSIMKIIELTYEEYLELESNGQLQDDTEYHISDWNENERTYLTTEDIQGMIDEKTDTKQDLKYFIKIEANTDLNDYTEPGTYRAMSYANYTSTLANVPVGIGTGFTLNVMQYTSDTANTSYRRQELITRERTFVRYTTDGGETWSNWLIMSSYDIGDILITSTNTNPSKRYGGSWELVNKDLKPTLWDNVSSLVTATDNVTMSLASAMITENSLFMRLEWTINVELGDSTVELFTINWEEMGISKTSFDMKLMPAGTDGGGGYAMINIENVSGVVQSVEIVQGDGSGTLASGSTFSFSFSAPIYYTNRLDSACDKFYWKRTA